MFACILLLGSCSEENKDEKAVKKVLETFYESINERDFKTLSKISSPQMKKHLDFMESFGNDLVLYDDYHVKEPKISGNRATASVIATDQFGNKTDCLWNLSKSNGVWLLDIFNYSSADRVEEKPKPQDNPQ